MVFIPQAQPHAQSLFLFPIVFGINFFSVRLSTYPKHAKLVYCIFNLEPGPSALETVAW